jgi:Mce-associated membrane protein
MSQQAAMGRRKIAGERNRRVPTESRLPAGPEAPADAASLTDSGIGVGEPARARPLHTVPGWLLIGLAVVATVVLVLDAVSWARSNTASAGSSALGATALNAAPAQAERAAEQILSYDYATLEQDTDAAAAYMTPAYGQTFQRTVDGLLADSATAQQGVVSAKVMGSGVVSADAGKVDVLLFVDQTSRTNASKQPQTALNRVVFAMVYQDGKWLVDDVTAL